MARIRWPICCSFFLLTFIFASPALAVPRVQPSERVTSNVVVRSQPSTESAPLDALSPGEQLELLGDVPRWYQVHLQDGRTGYVSKSWTVVVEITTAGPLRVHYINVDQGAANLLEFPCAAILIDAGGRGSAANAHLIEYLNNFFVHRPDLHNRLAAVFITHAHFDHDANLMRVAQNFGIDGFIYNGKADDRISEMVQRALTAQPAIPVVAVADDQLALADQHGFTNSTVDPVHCPDVDPEIRLLSGGRTTNPGWTNDQFSNPNNHSLVIRVDYGAASFLFTGDLEVPAIGKLVSRYSGSQMLNVDVYAVGHHGADNGTTAGLLAQMTPVIAVIPVGNPNTVNIPRSAWNYGHPRGSTIDLLQQAISRPRSAAVMMMTFDSGNGTPHAREIQQAIYANSRDGDVLVVASPEAVFSVQTSQ